MGSRRPVYEWWCGRLSALQGEPVYYWVYGVSSAEHDEGNNRSTLQGLFVRCSECSGKAPNEHGCRYVDKSRLEEMRAEAICAERVACRTAEWKALNDG